MIKAIVVATLLCWSSTAKSSEVEELARIIHAEAAGEGEVGMLAVGHASINRTNRTGRSFKKMLGVARSKTYSALSSKMARDALCSKDSVHGADSWNRSRYTGERSKPNTRILRIGNHTFYTMDGLA